MRYETILCVRILDATQIRRLSAFSFAADVTIVFGRFPSPSPLPRGFSAMSLVPVAPFNTSTNHDSEAGSGKLGIRFALEFADLLIRESRNGESVF